MSQGVALALSLHLVAMIAGGALLAMALRGGAGGRDDDGSGGSGGPPPPPPFTPRPRGGPPLPDARPARVRLRGPVRLARLLPAPIRRRSHPAAPVRPRTPARTATTRQSPSSNQMGHRP